MALIQVQRDFGSDAYHRSTGRSSSTPSGAATGPKLTLVLGEALPPVGPTRPGFVAAELGGARGGRRLQPAGADTRRLQHCLRA